MLRHVVMFRWAAGATAESKARVAAELARLPEAIGTIRQYSFGADAGLSAGAWDFGVVADFDDVDGYIAYRDHPAHRALIADWIRPILAERAALQLVLRQ